MKYIVIVPMYALAAIGLIGAMLGAFILATPFIMRDFVKYGRI